MAELSPVAGLWIGGSLTWLERLCLASFVRMGHPTALYTYGEVAGVPEGVEIRDGTTVVPTDDFTVHERSGSVALFSDLFRYHMMRKVPGTIWIDTDVFCLRPIDTGGPHVFGYEVQSTGEMNGAVLRLPPDSPALQLLLDLTADPYVIPEFVSAPAQARMRAAAEAGTPVHASGMRWGIWGPLAITWATRKTGEDRFCQHRDVFYPLPFKERNAVFKRPAKLERFLTPDSQAIHIWGRIKRYSGGVHGGTVPAGCWLARRLAEFGMDPAEYPVTGHGRLSYETEAPDTQEAQ